MTQRTLCLIAALLGAVGCSKKTQTQTIPDAGEPGEGACTSAAQAQANCQLQSGMQVLQYLWPAGTADWYYIDATSLPPRALLTITAGYHAPSSPVTLLVNVLASDGMTSLGEMSDPGMDGAPSVFNLVIPISQPGGYYVIVEDDLSTAQNPTGDGDPEHEYSLSYTISSDPDMSGHTFGTATPVDLSSGTATASGVLSTPGDIDYFAVQVNPSFPRPILYFSVDSPQFEEGNQTTIQYAIYASADGGAPVATGATTNPTGEQTISTAILLPEQAGEYFVTIQGEPSPAPGNPNFVYNLGFQLIPDLDTNEPNDDPTVATPIDFTNPGATTPATIQKEGRIAYVPDPDWYIIKIPASTTNSRLYFSMGFNDNAANNARYPPMPTSFNHNLLFSLLSPAADECENACPGDPQTAAIYCTSAIAIVDGGAYFPCPYSLRAQSPKYQKLDNFEGAIPIAASTSETDIYALVYVPDLGADDQAYDLSVTWEPATPDEATSFQNSYASIYQPTSIGLQSSSSDVPQGGEIDGSLSYGNFLQSQSGDNAPNNAGLLPQAPNDYDALRDGHVYEIDVQVINYPDGGSNLTNGVIDGGAYPDGGFLDGGPNYIDLSMSLQWIIPPGVAMQGTNQQSQDAGARPWDMFITAIFCSPDDNGASGCDPVVGKWRTYNLGYASGSLSSWEGGAPTPVYSLDQGTGTFLSLPPECLCLESRFVKGLAETGKFYVQTAGVDRTSYSDSTYQLSVALGPYPQIYTSGDGGTGPCPAVCKFCSQGGGGDCPTIQGLPTGPGPIP